MPAAFAWFIAYVTPIFKCGHMHIHYYPNVKNIFFNILHLTLPAYKSDMINKPFRVKVIKFPRDKNVDIMSKQKHMLENTMLCQENKMLLVLDQLSR